MPGKNVSNLLKISLFVTLILVVAWLWSFTSPTKLNESVQTSSTTSITYTTTTTAATNKSLTREVFLDVKSGEGLLWFSDAVVKDVRSAMKIWEEKTNYMINFEEVGRESVADIIIRFSETFNVTSEGKKTIGEAYIYMNEVRGIIYILPSAISCRNQVRAMHEIGHIIGLNHSTNYNSIMHPIESCVQNITDEDSRAAVELISQFL